MDIANIAHLQCPIYSTNRQKGAKDKTNARNDREENVYKNYEWIKSYALSKVRTLIKPITVRLNRRSGHPKEIPDAMFRYWRIVFGGGCY